MREINSQGIRMKQSISIAVVYIFILNTVLASVGRAAESGAEFSDIESTYGGTAPTTRDKISIKKSDRSVVEINQNQLNGKGIYLKKLKYVKGKILTIGDKTADQILAAIDQTSTPSLKSSSGGSLAEASNNPVSAAKRPVSHYGSQWTPNFYGGQNVANKTGQFGSNLTSVEPTLKAEQDLKPTGSLSQFKKKPVAAAVEQVTSGESAVPAYIMGSQADVDLAVKEKDGVDGSTTTEINQGNVTIPALSDADTAKLAEEFWPI